MERFFFVQIKSYLFLLFILELIFFIHNFILKVKNYILNCLLTFYVRHVFRKKHAFYFCIKKKINKKMISFLF